MRFQALLNESNTKCSVVEIHRLLKLELLYVIIKWKSIHYFAYSLKTLLFTAERNVAQK